MRERLGGTGRSLVRFGLDISNGCVGPNHRALIIKEKVRQEGEGGGLELQLPASSFLNDLLVYSIISVDCLFITNEWLESKIFYYNLFLRRQ